MGNTSISGNGKNRKSCVRLMVNSVTISHQGWCQWRWSTESSTLHNCYMESLSRKVKIVSLRIALSDDLVLIAGIKGSGKEAYNLERLISSKLLSLNIESQASDLCLLYQNESRLVRPCFIWDTDGMMLLWSKNSWSMLDIINLKLMLLQKCFQHEMLAKFNYGLSSHTLTF